jgi:uncharacterized protein (TIGR00251 family)
MADGSLKVKVHAKPIAGKANLQLVEFLADQLHVAKGDISIIRGEHSRRKDLKITGIEQPELELLISKIAVDQDP